MTKIDLGQIITILANLGVIAGIVFLGIEVQQNNQLLISQTSFAQFSSERERISTYIDNVDGIIDTLFKAQRREQLTDVEAFQLDRLYESYLLSWRWQFREVEAGRMPSDLIDVAGIRFIWRSNLRLAGLMADMTERLGPNFVRFIEEIVSDQPVSP